MIAPVNFSIMPAFQGKKKTTKKKNNSHKANNNHHKTNNSSHKTNNNARKANGDTFKRTNTAQKKTNSANSRTSTPQKKTNKADNKASSSKIQFNDVPQKIFITAIAALNVFLANMPPKKAEARSTTSETSIVEEQTKSPADGFLTAGEEVTLWVEPETTAEETTVEETTTQEPTTAAETTTKKKTDSYKQVKNISVNIARVLDKKLGDGFCTKVEAIAKKVKCNPNDLLAIMFSESGINPKKIGYNGATGLIQFMPSTMKAYGVTSEKLKSLSAIQQLDYVERLFMENKKSFMGLKPQVDSGTLYSLCFLPLRAKNEVLCNNSNVLTWAYEDNKGLDLDKNGSITKTELAQRIEQKFKEMRAAFKC